MLILNRKNKKLLLNDFREICIIQTAFIGDIILSVYLAEIIKYTNPMSNTCFVIPKKSFDFLKVIPSVNKVIVYDKRDLHKGIKGIITLTKILKEQSCELIFAPHKSLRTSLLTFLTKPKVSCGFANASFAFLYSHKAEYFPFLHEIERVVALLSFFDDVKIPDYLPKITFNFSTKTLSFIEKLFSKYKLNNKKIISIAPTSVWKTKQWNSENFAFVAKELVRENYSVFIIGSLKEAPTCNEIASKSNSISLAGETDLETVLALISVSSLLISNDSSPTHFATLANTPSITIFGPTISEFGFYPRSTISRVIENKDLKCRPCSIHGLNSCPLGHHNCMNKISPTEVLSVALELLKK